MPSRGNAEGAAVEMPPPDTATSKAKPAQRQARGRGWFGPSHRFDQVAPPAAPTAAVAEKSSEQLAAGEGVERERVAVPEEESRATTPRAEDFLERAATAFRLADVPSDRWAKEREPTPRAGDDLSASGSIKGNGGASEEGDSLSDLVEPTPHAWLHLTQDSRIQGR